RTSSGMAVVASITAWISALSAAILGLAGVFFTVWQWLASDFRPKIEAEVEARGDAIRVSIWNRGRMDGIVDRVVVTDERQIQKDFEVEVEGMVGGYQPIVLPKASAMRLILMAPEGGKFAPTDRVVISWRDKKKVASLLPIDVG